MASDKVYIAIALEVEEDHPVADLVYDGTQWARVRVVDRQLVVTLYVPGQSSSIPLDDALASLQEAQERLLELTADDGLAGAS